MLSTLSISVCEGILFVVWRTFIYLPCRKRVMKKLVILLILLAACAQQPVQLPVQQVPVQEIPIIEPTSTPIVPLVEKCVDPDGTDEFVQGTVAKGDKVLNDACLSIKRDGQLVPISKVAEYTCENNEIVSRVINCAFACRRGACLRNVEKQQLVADGACKTGKVGFFSITKCYDSCLPNTQCAPAPLKTRHFSLPYQLSCIVPSDSWVVDRWFEFEVEQQVEALVFVDVAGSEFVRIEVRDASERLVAVPLAKRISENRCFGEGSGFASASLPKGKYEVRISAKGDGTDKFRSFKAKNFSIAVLT